MKEIQINIAPLSVNKCWQGKRFKTVDYKMYEKNVVLLLPKIKLCDPPYEIYYEFGMSNILSDFDNPVKPFTDILQKKYLFNDKDIFKATIVKRKVANGSEYIRFSLNSF